MKRALIVVDVQNDYFPGGAMELFGSEEAGANVARVIAKCRADGDAVIHVRHVSTRAGATFFLPGTRGAEIHGCARPMDGEPVIVKHYPSSFRETDLDGMLKREGIGELVIVGMMTHMCVDTTVRAAFDLGYSCTVVGDCCATKALSHAGRAVRAEDAHAAFLAALDGTFAKVVRAEEFLSA